MNRSFLTPTQRWIAAGCLVAAPLLFAAAEFLSPSGEGTPDQLLDALAAASRTAPLGLVAGLLSSAFFVPGLFGLLSRPMARGRLLAEAGLTLLYYGLLANIALGGLNVMFLAMADPRMDRAAMVQLFDRMTREPVVGPLLAGHYLMALGALLLGLGLWRGGVGPRWAAAAVGLSGVTDAALGMVAPDLVASVVSNGLLIGGFVAYAWTVSRESRPTTAVHPATHPASSTTMA
ncbi:hypothetical protein [Raineyella fluvialis]|uniref:DUF4386 family protein n=1 Tax=Raineyella fluvialis TaxID=2662261 RepID=A0A5Q2F890_9ACTN|nr:hypothetical protein [Raineyella fluvialis]QGF23180.1 hypothetical protein Rai3103_05340 [Raineyella fluvialis]